MSKRVIATNIFMWIVLVFLAYMGENVVVFDTNFSRHLFTQEFFVLFAAVTGMVVLYFILERKKNKLSFNWLLFALLTIFVISNTIVIFLTPSSEYIEVTRPNGVVVGAMNTLSIAQRFEFAGLGILLAVAFYIVIGVLPKKMIVQRQLNFILYAICIFAFISCIYSYALESDKYVYFFEHGVFDTASGCQSFFINQNIYGFFMLLAIVVLMFIQSMKPRFYNYFFMAFFVANVFATTSRTSMFLSVVIAAVFFLARFFITIKRHTTRNIVTLLITVVVLGAGSGIFSYLLTVDSVLYYNWHEFWDALFNEATGISRYQLWQIAIGLINDNPLYLISGRGYGLFAYVFSFADKLYSPGGSVYAVHNGFIEAFCDGGIIGIGIYAIALIYLVYVSIHLLKKETGIAVTTLISLCFFLAHGFLESTFFFELSTKGLAITIVAFVPALSSWNRLKNREDVEDLKTVPVIKQKVRYSLSSIDIAKMTSFITSFFAFVTLGLTPLFVQMVPVQSGMFMFYFLIVFLWITAPRLVMDLWELYVRKKKAFALMLILSLVLLICLPVTVYYFAPTMMSIFLPIFLGMIVLLFVMELNLAYIKNIKEYFTSVIAPFVAPNILVCIFACSLSCSLISVIPSMVVFIGLLSFIFYIILTAFFPLLSDYRSLFNNTLNYASNRYKYRLQRLMIKDELKAFKRSRVRFKEEWDE